MVPLVLVGFPGQLQPRQAQPDLLWGHEHVEDAAPDDRHALEVLQRVAVRVVTIAVHQLGRVVEDSHGRHTRSLNSSKSSGVPIDHMSTSV